MSYTSQKLASLFRVIRITQSPHGKWQNYKALDTSNRYGQLICPVDGCKVVFVKELGQDSYFNILLPDEDKTIIQAVHGKPTKVNQEFKKGEVMGNLLPYVNNEGQRADHWHIAINHKSKWYVLLDFIDRSTPLEVSYYVDKKWGQWATYQDLYLKLPTETTPPISMNSQLTPQDQQLLTQSINDCKAYLASKQEHIDRLQSDKFVISYQDFLKRIERDSETIDKQNQSLIQSRKRIEELEKELNQAKEFAKIAFEDARKTKEDTRFSLNKFAVGASKNGTLYAFLGTAVTLGVNLLLTKIPELEAYRGDITTALLLLTGASTAGQAGANIAKNSIKK